MLGYHGFSLEWDGQDKLLSATKADGTRIENFCGFDGERLVEVVRRPGRAPEAHRFVFDGYLLHGDATWVVSAGPLNVAEVTGSEDLRDTDDAVGSSAPCWGLGAAGPLGSLAESTSAVGAHVLGLESSVTALGERPSAQDKQQL